MDKTLMHINTDDDIYDYLCHKAYVRSVEERRRVTLTEVVNEMLRKGMEENKEG